MRNPMNSWDKSDSWFDVDGSEFGIGDNDLRLMRNLCNGGADDRKFLRMIVVYADITAPLYFWKQADCYSVGVTKSSCSTMHKIHSRDLTVDDFSFEKLTDEAFCNLKGTIKLINWYRKIYVSWDDIDERGRNELLLDSKEDAWWQMIQLLPESYNQRRTVMLNYEVLRNMYHARKGHKLDEWHELCLWAENLPYAFELIF